MESHLVSLTHNKRARTSQWPTLGMVEALVRRLEGGGDNGGYILGMCSDLSLVALHSGPNFFLVSFWMLKSLVLSFQIGVLGETLRITLLLIVYYKFLNENV